MKLKVFLFGVITTLVVIILFNNKEEASFWLFGEIRTSKLFILGVFFILGVITGGIMFRRKKRQPKMENTDQATIPGSPETDTRSSHTDLSEEDRKFLGE